MEMKGCSEEVSQLSVKGVVAEFGTLADHSLAFSLLDSFYALRCSYFVSSLSSNYIFSDWLDR
jgi:hypothetical protein